jgi:hypothetical protein
MGLRAFTRDGVFRAGFGYSGSFYFIRYFGASNPRNIPAPCQFTYPLTYTISGIELMQGYIRRPPWQTANDTNDYTKPPYTVVNTNQNPSGKYGNPASNLTCRELGQLIWELPQTNYVLAYVTASTRGGAHPSVPNGSWVIMRITYGSGIQTFAYVIGSRLSPPRTGWILAEFNIDPALNNGEWFRGSLSLR